MLRGDDVICGVASVTSGNPTLQSPPTPPGGLDFDTWLIALGYTTNDVVPVTYTIEEYTSATFSTVKGKGKGVGTYTVGTKVLTRTNDQFSITGMDTGSPAFSLTANYTISNVANTLVYCAASAADIPFQHPYFVSGQAGQDSNWGVSPDGMDRAVSIGNGAGFTVGTRSYFYPFRWSVPMFVKRCTLRVTVSTPTTPRLWMRLYAPGSDGRPGRLLYDFSGASNYAAPTSPGLATCNNAGGGNGFPLYPGDYWLQLIGDCASGSFNPQAPSAIYYGSSPAATRLGVLTGIVPSSLANVSSPTDTGAAPGTAALTGTSVQSAGSILMPIFGLSPT